MNHRDIILRLRRGLWPLTWPMGLTLLRLLLVPVFLYFVAQGRIDLCRWIALTVLMIMAISDYLDGYLARKWNQTSLLGTLLDPTADKLLVTGALIILCFPRFAPAGFAIPWCVPLGIYIKDFGVIAGLIVVRYRLGKVEINASRPGKISTVSQIMLIVATLLAPDLIRVSPMGAAGLLWCLWWAAVVTAAIAGMGYACEGARQIRNSKRVDAQFNPFYGKHDHGARVVKM